MSALRSNKGSMRKSRRGQGNNGKRKHRYSENSWTRKGSRSFLRIVRGWQAGSYSFLLLGSESTDRTIFPCMFVPARARSVQVRSAHVELTCVWCAWHRTSRAHSARTQSITPRHIAKQALQLAWLMCAPDECDNSGAGSFVQQVCCTLPDKQ